MTGRSESKSTALRSRFQGSFRIITWRLRIGSFEFPQPAGPELANLAYQQLYQRDDSPEIPRDFVVRDEYLGWVIKKPFAYT